MELLLIHLDALLIRIWMLTARHGRTMVTFLDARVTSWKGYGNVYEDRVDDVGIVLAL